jgi:hypothetical protein
MKNYSGPGPNLLVPTLSSGKHRDNAESCLCESVTKDAGCNGQDVGPRALAIESDGAARP